jgi:protein-disulfide isomerase
MADLRSAPLPAVGADDHVRGPAGAPLVIVYGDYECPFCAALEVRLHDLPLRVVFRHFPVRGSHPRAFAAACAAEAAARQDAFWPMHDALFADQGRLEDPHLWERAERLGLDVTRFDADRRDAAVAERVTADFRGGVRAGVPTTPTLFAGGERHAGRPDDALWARLSNLVPG